MAITIARALDPENYDVTLLVQERFGHLFDALPPRLRVKYINEGEYRRSHLLKSLVVTIREAMRNDVVVGANEGRASLFALVAAKLARRPAIGWIHAGWASFGSSTSWKQKLALRAYRWFDKVVACSHGASRDIIGIMPELSERMEVIHNCIDLTAVDAESHSAVEAEDTGLFDGPTVITAGRLGYPKNQEALIEAHAKILALGLPHKLVILGQGPDHGKLSRAAKNLGVSASVHIVGFRQRPSRYMARASVFGLTSINEAFPLVLIEAMRSGTPIVAFDCPHGPREAMIGGSGVLVPLNDVNGLTAALYKVLSDPGHADDLRRAGLARCEAFDTNKIILNWQRLIDEVVD